MNRQPDDPGIDVPHTGALCSSRTIRERSIPGAFETGIALGMMLLGLGVVVAFAVSTVTGVLWWMGVLR